MLRQIQGPGIVFLTAGLIGSTNMSGGGLGWKFYRRRSFDSEKQRGRRTLVFVPAIFRTQARLGPLLRLLP